MIKRLGITGGIGAGKSSVSALLRQAGMIVTDADELARAAVADAAVCSQIADLWPEVVAGDTFDRGKMAEIAFADEGARLRLEGIVHPWIRDATARATAEAEAAGQTWIAHDVPLLFETGLNEEMNRVWTVDAPLQLRQARLQARSGLSPEQIAAREAAQVSAELRRECADLVIFNDGDGAQLRRQVEFALSTLQGFEPSWASTPSFDAIFPNLT